MKKFLIAAAMIAASVTLSAQQKGDFSVGGALGVGGGVLTVKNILLQPMVKHKATKAALRRLRISSSLLCSTIS